MLRKIYMPLATIILVLATLGAGAYALQYNGEGEPEIDPERLDLVNDQIPGSDGIESLAHKNETVYVLLEHDGSLREYSIVNRIYDIENDAAELLVDYGAYIYAENMTSSTEPLVKDDRVVWPAGLLDDGDLYYEGTMARDLPFSIDITYLLDGEEVSPEELAGSSGRLDLIIRFTNHLLYAEQVTYLDYYGSIAYADKDIYVPLLVQGSLELDLDKYTNIEHDESLSIVMGQNASINFMSFPYPESEIVISMDGVDIELERINLMIAPQLPPLPEVDLEAALLQMIEGLSPLSEGLAGLSEGADYLLEGLMRFEKESRELLVGTEDLSQLVEQYMQQRAGYLDMINNADHAAIITALENLNLVIENIEQLPDPGLINRELELAVQEADAAAETLENIDKALSEISGSSGQIVVLAERLINQNEPGTDLYNLGLALLERENQVGRLMQDVGDVIFSITSAQQAIGNAGDSWMAEYYPALLALQELNEILLLADRELPVMIEEMDRLVEYLSEADQFIARSGEMIDSLEEIPLALEQMMEGQRELRDGINQFNESGIMVMEKGLIDAVNESRAGKAQIELMRELADQYRSFADNDLNRHSEIRFIVQTPRLMDQAANREALQQDEYEGPEKESWASIAWERLLLLFK